MSDKNFKGSKNVQSPTQQPEQNKQKGKQKRHSLKGQTLDTKDGKGKSAGTKDGKGKPHSLKGASPVVKDVPTIITDESPDLYEDMDEATLSTYRDLFNMLDQSNTGIITADSLYKELHSVDNEITFKEVDNVLKKVDKDGNGVIDFDQFLYHMTHMGNDPDESADDETKKKYRKRKRMFYNAITKFSIQQTLDEIEKTLKTHSPHVLSHYVAGARLLGMTNRMLKRQMKKMVKNSLKNNDSPYARPLPFVHMGRKTLVHKKNIIPALDTPALNRNLQLEEEEVPETPPAVVEDLNSLQNTMKLFNETAQTDVGMKLPDANLIVKLRKEIGSVSAQLKQGSGSAPSDLTPVSPHYPAPPSIQIDSPASSVMCDDRSSSTIPSFLGQKSISKMKSHTINAVPSSFNVEEAKAIRRKRRIGTGWKAPRINYDKAPMPILHFKLKENLTFDNLARVRKKVEKAIADYFKSLQKVEIKTAAEQWNRIYSHVPLPKKQKALFKEVYFTYTAHREEDSFVICPWEPSPLSYIRRPNRSQSQPKYFNGGRRIKSSLDNLIVKPLINIRYGSTSPSPRSTPDLCCCFGKKPFSM